MNNMYIEYIKKCVILLYSINEQIKSKRINNISFYQKKYNYSKNIIFSILKNNFHIFFKYKSIEDIYRNIIIKKNKNIMVKFIIYDINVEFQYITKCEKMLKTIFILLDNL
uniref:Uncharacterized protein n=1 Tax=Pithovirus LCDPAC02 TaxID=2506601 RepID=A0A481YR49_9VIRU|nr:MAG: hypothetical protein LCDPAC02_01150 [Pithovirus LCDPAC02]